MVGFFNRNKTSFKPFSFEQQEATLAFLQEDFGELWNDDVETLYTKLMRTLGSDFSLPRNIDINYKTKALVFAQELEDNGERQDKDEIYSIFKAKEGFIQANAKSITFIGASDNYKFLPEHALEMAFMAAHDKQMLKQGITLEGINDYQKSLLQLSIMHYQPNIKIHNPVKIDARAQNDFNAYLASINAPEETAQNNPQEENKTSDIPTDSNSSEQEPDKVDDDFAKFFEENLEASGVYDNRQDEGNNETQTSEPFATPENSAAKNDQPLEDDFAQFFDEEPAGDVSDTTPSDKNNATNKKAETPESSAEQGILETVQHGNSPIINRYLQDNEMVRGLKNKPEPQSENTRHFCDASSHSGKTGKENKNPNARHSETLNFTKGPNGTYGLKL